jgi:hypothetical protein
VFFMVLMGELPADKWGELTQNPGSDVPGSPEAGSQTEHTKFVQAVSGHSIPDTSEVEPLFSEACLVPGSPVADAAITLVRPKGSSKW